MQIHTAMTPVVEVEVSKFTDDAAVAFLAKATEAFRTNKHIIGQVP